MHGGLDHGANHDVDAVAERLAAEAVAHELLRSDAAEERWPGMRFEGTSSSIRRPGRWMPRWRSRPSWRGSASRRKVLQETRVVRCFRAMAGARSSWPAASGWRPGSGGRGGRLGRPLLHGRVTLPPLSVTQQQIFHFPRLDPDAEQWPSVIHDELTPIYHLAGGRDGGPGEDRKIAEHRHGTATTASGRSGIVDPASRARIVEYVRRWLPGLDPTPGREATCLYTTTPNEDFVLDRAGTLVVCSACSGHGAKFAPLIGEMTAELVTAPHRAQIPARFRIPSDGSTPGSRRE